MAAVELASVRGLVLTLVDRDGRIGIDTSMSSAGRSTLRVVNLSGSAVVVSLSKGATSLARAPVEAGATFTFRAPQLVTNASGR